jgi:hypothetical protein
VIRFDESDHSRIILCLPHFPSRRPDSAGLKML